MFEERELLAEIGNLRKFSLRLTKNTSDAEDLLQSTLLRALENKNSFQRDTNLFSWSSKIMFNLFASQYRRKKKFETQHDPVPYLEQIVTGPSQEACADLATVREHMKRLSKDLHEILTLICLQDMPYEEAAAFLHIPLGTVRSRLSRARQKMQDMLEPAQDTCAHSPLIKLAAKGTC